MQAYSRLAVFLVIFLVVECCALGAEKAIPEKIAEDVLIKEATDGFHLTVTYAMAAIQDNLLSRQDAGIMTCKTLFTDHASAEARKRKCTPEFDWKVIKIEVTRTNCVANGLVRCLKQE